MLRKSKKIISIMMVVFSLFCVSFMFAGCKKSKKNNNNSEVPDAPVVVNLIELTDEMVLIEYDSVVYNRAEKQPIVIVSDGDDVIDDSEYTVSYSNNINVGTATVTVSANEDSDVIKGSATRNFEITPAQLGDIEPMSYAIYTGESLKPSVYMENHVLGTDYTLSWEYKELLADDSTYAVLDETNNNFVQPGEYRVTASGVGNYQGTVSQVFAIYYPLPEMAEVNDVSYDGLSHVPEVVIDDLVEGVDYSISYEIRNLNDSSEQFYTYDPTKDNPFTDAFEYRIVATGMGRYAGDVYEIFKINKIEIPNVTISNSATYSGEAQTPQYSVEGLTENLNYTVSWQFRKFGGTYSNYNLHYNASKNFINAGEYKITVTGIGNYTGTKEAVFVINKTTLYADVSRQSYVYNSANDKIGIITLADGSWSVTYYCTSVAADSDDITADSWFLYEVDDVLDIGVYYIYAVVAESDNYIESVTDVSSFEVYADEIQEVVYVGSDSYNYNGTAYDPYPYIEVGSLNNDSLLVKGVDYDISWWVIQNGVEVVYELDDDASKNFVNPGIYKGYLMPKGNYVITSGEINRIVVFAINPGTFDSFIVERDSYTYGEQPTAFELTDHDTENGVSTLGATIIYKYRRITETDNDWQVLDENTQLDVGNYYIKAEASKEHYTTKSSYPVYVFSVYKATLSDILLTLQTENDFSSKQLENYNSDWGGVVSYYYNTTDSSTGGVYFEDISTLEPGTYYIYAVIAGMTNYENYTTNTVVIVIE